MRTKERKANSEFVTSSSEVHTAVKELQSRAYDVDGINPKS